jgi:transcriptional regulator with XRE-family HTH domain
MHDPSEFGNRVRRLRRERGMTLKELATSARCSATHLSEIERGETSPTLGGLTRIAEALGKPRAFFLEDEELPEVSVVRKGNRPRDVQDRSIALCELLTAGIPGSRIEVRHLRLDPFQESQLHHHSGEEGGLVLAGTVEARVGRETHVLRAGHVVFFPANRPHQLRNPGDSPAELFWVTLRSAAV